MLLDVTDVLVDPEMTETVNVMRFAEGSFDPDREGVWIKGAMTNIEIIGSVQAGTSDMLQVLPEGERDKATIVVYSASEIIKGNGTTLESDVILYEGNTYRVAWSQSYPSFNVWMAIAVIFYS